MIISNFSTKKLIRYPSIFFRISSLSLPYSFPLSIPKTLNSSFSLYSHKTFPTRYFYSSSTRLPSYLYAPHQFSHSSNSNVFTFNTSYIYSIHCIGLNRPLLCPFRWLTGSSSVGKLSSVFLKTAKSSEFEGTGSSSVGKLSSVFLKTDKSSEFEGTGSSSVGKLSSVFLKTSESSEIEGTGSSAVGKLSSVFLKTDKSSEFEGTGSSFVGKLSSVFLKTDKSIEFERTENDEPVDKTHKIMELISSGEEDLNSKFNSMDLNISVPSISVTLRVLNYKRVSAFTFYQWLLDKNPNLYQNYDFCSLIIDNCGQLNDYKTMVYMLNVFKQKQICLTQNAFGFLFSSKTEVKESIRRFVGVLNEVGGSCKGSGISALINELCQMDSFELAKFVIEITERKASYYNILIRRRCKMFQIEEAKDLISEMRESGCDVDTKTYNYLLSCLCKKGQFSEVSTFLKEFKEMGFSPDPLTFEIFVNFVCKLGKLDNAHKFLDSMASMDLEPQYKTHAAIIKGYFQSGQYKKALKYVQDQGEKGVKSICMIYDLLARLHQKNGDLIAAQSILNEMMDKGLQPTFFVYDKTTKQLDQRGNKILASRLRSNYAKFTTE